MGRRVLIAGGGIVGLSTAYYAARKGHDVTVLERTAEGGGCAYGSAGMIVPSHFTPLAAPGMVALALRWMGNPESPFYVKPRLDPALLGWGFRFWRAATARNVARAAPLLRDLNLASRALFLEWAEAWGDDFGLATKGLLMLCKTGHGLEEEARTAGEAERLGIPARVLDASGTAELEPNVRMDVAGAVYFPMDCHLTPARLLAALERELTRAGVVITRGVEVTGWRVEHGRVKAARTKGADLEADEYVLTAGARSTAVARDLSLDIPMQAGKGYSLTLPKPRVKPEICAILSEARVAVTPMGGALRVGGTMEMSGLDERIDPARVRGIIRSVPRYLPDFSADDFAGVPAWSGLRPCSPDGLPYIGRSRRHANLSIATGHSMMGLSMGPITGKLMAEILSGEKPSLDIAALSPDRYS